MRSLWLPLLLCALQPALAQMEDEDSLLVVHAATVVTVSGDSLSPGSIVIRNGKIEAVGQRVDVPVSARVIEARDQVVMPALISPRTRFSLEGYDRRGNSAHTSAAQELLLRPGQLQPLTEAGYGVAAFIPAGTGIPGRASLLRPADQAALPGQGYLRVTLASLPRDKQELQKALEQAKQAIAREAKARSEWEKKKGGAAAPPARRGRRGAALAASAPSELAEAAPVESKTPAFEPPEIPGPLEPFVKLLRKAKDAPRLLVEVDGASDLLHLDALLERYEVQVFAIHLDNGDESDLFHVVPRLGERKAKVLLYPRLSHEAYTLTRRNLPAELAAAGAEVSFLPLTDGPHGHRRLLEAAGLIHRDGLSRKATLEALTLHPAALLGLEAERGSLEPGKRADLLLLDGDPLAAGSRPTQLILAGEPVWSRR